MKRLSLRLAAALLLLPINCYAAQPPGKPAATITITVPAGDVQPGDDVDLAVAGVTAADLVPGKIYFLPPENATARCKLVVQWAATGLEPVITFRAKSAGSYRVTLVKALPAEQLLAATAVVVVKGAPPPPDPPDPGPGPGPSPNPPSKPKALVIEEQSQRTAAQAVVLSSLKVRAVFSGGFVVEDKDVRDSKGQTPAKLQPYIDTAVKAGLPYLFIFDDAGKLWKETKLPATVDDTLGLLKKGR